jgi:hypothetical protein
MVAAGMLCALSMLAHGGREEPILGIAEGEALKRATLAPPAGAPVSIRVLPGDWGGADREDVENLLRSVARELWVYFPGRTLNSILVAPTERHPIAGYSKGPEGEYFVYLSAKGRHWSQVCLPVRARVRAHPFELRASRPQPGAPQPVVRREPLRDGVALHGAQAGRVLAERRHGAVPALEDLWRRDADLRARPAGAAAPGAAA